MQFNFKHTLYASYIGYITQAIVNNLAPLLFATFQSDLGISIELIACSSPSTLSSKWR